MISQGTESGDGGCRIREDSEVDFRVSSSIGEKDDSKETQFTREPPAMVQFAAELHEEVLLRFSISLSCVSMALVLGLFSCVILLVTESCLWREKKCEVES